MLYLHLPDLAKNAILIVQFALERRQTGMAISWSAVLGAAARLRPILMTSLAMVSASYPDDLIGYGYRSAAYDVRLGCR